MHGGRIGDVLPLSLSAGAVVQESDQKRDVRRGGGHAGFPVVRGELLLRRRTFRERRMEEFEGGDERFREGQGVVCDDIGLDSSVVADLFCGFVGVDF